MDLEGLREIFSDKKTHIAIAKIVKVMVSSDRSFARCLVLIMPEQIEYVAKITLDMAGGESGVFQLPSPDDFVLVAFADGDPNQCYIIRKLTSLDDKIPLRAKDGDLTVISLAGKKSWISSDTRINLSKGTTEPTENLVLGQVFKQLMIDMLNKIDELTLKVKSLTDDVATHNHLGNAGWPTSVPLQSAAFNSLSSDFTGISGDFNDIKSSPVEDEAVLSDLSFTEKG